MDRLCRKCGSDEVLDYVALCRGCKQEKDREYRKTPESKAARKAQAHAKYLRMRDEILARCKRWAGSQRGQSVRREYERKRSERNAEAARENRKKRQIEAESRKRERLERLERASAERATERAEWMNAVCACGSQFVRHQKRRTACDVCSSKRKRTNAIESLRLRAKDHGPGFWFLRKSAWREAHPVEYKAAKARSRWMREARMSGIRGTCTQKQLEGRIDFYERRCAYCGGPYEAIDHVIPVAKGGTNWPANLRPACNECNSSKGARGLSEWLAPRQPCHVGICLPTPGVVVQ